jgi:hypothetical protein
MKVSATHRWYLDLPVDVYTAEAKCVSARNLARPTSPKPFILFTELKNPYLDIIIIGCTELRVVKTFLGCARTRQSMGVISLTLRPLYFC